MMKMSIKLKMALWYGLLTTILMVLFLIISFSWLSRSMYTDLEVKTREYAEQIASDLILENSNEIKVPSDYTYANNKMVAVLDKNGKVLFNNTKFSWINKRPYLNNDYSDKAVGTQKLLIYDKKIVRNNNVIAIVRVCNSKDETASKLFKIGLVMFIGGTLFIVLAIGGGYLIAARSLSPIFKITETAKKIESGDLSVRITEVDSKDEVGILADAFNSMLENVETSFNREKQFASDASHELRTPVAIIMNNSEQLIRKANANDDLLEEYQAIFFESKRMEKIISQLLYLIRGNEGRYKLDIEKIELGEIISTITEQLDEYANENNICISFVKCNDIFIEADQTLIIQMLLNIIENAIKYTSKDGFVKVEITKNDNDAVIKISDNGIGISNDDLPHIFERFYRADKSRDRTGTGLGLSIVKWIVDVHHGKIDVKSILDEGTTFIITLKKSAK